MSAFIYLLISAEKNVSKKCWILLCAVLALQAYVVIWFTLPSDNVGTTTFGPLHFFLTYPKWGLTNLLTICLAGYFHVRDIRRGGGRWPEAALLMMLVAVAPALLLRIEGGSAYYFLNIGTWIAIASLAGRVIDWADHMKPVAMVASLAVIVVSVVTHPEKSTSYSRLKQQRDALYERLDPADKSGIWALGLFNRHALEALAVKSSESTGAKIGRLLSDVHASAGDNLLVMVSPEFSSFWKLTHYCEASAFVIPAVFGLPLLHGLPPLAEKCDLGAYYGYASYGSDSSASNGGDDATLCRLTLERGFASLVILRSDHEVRRLECGQVSSGSENRTGQ
jgi:hypothetical protein